MPTTGNIIFLIAAVIIFIYVARHTNEWARRAQEKDIKNAEKSAFNFVPPERWGTNFMFNIIRFGIIFSTLILIALAYGALFGTGNTPY